MDTSEQSRKLRQIASLTAGELHGWWRYVHGWRQPFDGELAALLDRARALRIDLPVNSSPAAP